jgi:hypothetical protein
MFIRCGQGRHSCLPIHRVSNPVFILSLRLRKSGRKSVKTGDWKVTGTGRLESLPYITPP